MHIHELTVQFQRKIGIDSVDFCEELALSSEAPSLMAKFQSLQSAKVRGIEDISRLHIGVWGKLEIPTPVTLHVGLGITLTLGMEIGIKDFFPIVVLHEFSTNL